MGWDWRIIGWVVGMLAVVIPVWFGILWLMTRTPKDPD